jgi:hypothetical protein
MLAACTRMMLAPFGQCIGRARVGDHVRLKERKLVQLGGRGASQRLVLFLRQRWQHVPCLAGDDDSGSAGADDPAELLENVGDADQVDGDDRLRGSLRRRQAGCVDEMGDAPEFRGGLGQLSHRFAEGDVDAGSAGLKACTLQSAHGRQSGFVVQVSQQDRGADPDPAGDRLADGPSANDDDDLGRFRSAHVHFSAGDPRLVSAIPTRLCSAATAR